MAFDKTDLDVGPSLSPAPRARGRRPGQALTGCLTQLRALRGPFLPGRCTSRREHIQSTGAESTCLLMAKGRSSRLGFFARWFSGNILPNKTFPNCLEADHSNNRGSPLDIKPTPGRRKTSLPFSAEKLQPLWGPQPEDVSEESFIAVA